MRNIENAGPICDVVQEQPDSRHTAVREKTMPEHAEKMVITVFGRDRPGIVARVSGLLARMDCNIEDASQTILYGRFAGMFVVRPLKPLALGELQQRLAEDFHGQELVFWTSPVEKETAGPVAENTAPFVVTTTGPDQVGLVAGITEVLARFGVNINALRANVKTEDASQWVMIYEVDVPERIDRKRFREALYARAEALGQQLSLQHRDIFEAVHRI